MNKTVYLGLGSNLGDRAANIEAALGRLEAEGLRMVRRSSWYETEPQEVRSQPWFLNIVIEAETSLLPRKLLGLIQRIETELGRKPSLNKGPRLIDIDILFFGRAVIDSGVLTVPHPALAKRRFVLAPLAEIAPELRHPVTKQSVAEMLGELSGQTVRKISVT